MTRRALLRSFIAALEVGIVAHVFSKSAAERVARTVRDYERDGGDRGGKRRRHRERAPEIYRMVVSDPDPSPEDHPEVMLAKFRSDEGGVPGDKEVPVRKFWASHTAGQEIYAISPQGGVYAGPLMYAAEEEDEKPVILHELPATVDSVYFFIQGNSAIEAGKWEYVGVLYANNPEETGHDGFQPAPAQEGDPLFNSKAYNLAEFGPGIATPGTADGITTEILPVPTNSLVLCHRHTNGLWFERCNPVTITCE